jgi:hypothetical protein
MKTKDYTLIERTPQDMSCFGGIGCPAIYELTPKQMKCGIGACPSIYSTRESSYLIIGRQLTAEEIKEKGLEKKVGVGEALIEVPKKLIDKRQRDDMDQE